MTHDELIAKVEEIRRTATSPSKGMARYGVHALDAIAELLALIDHLEAEIARLEGEVRAQHSRCCMRQYSDTCADCIAEHGHDECPCPVCRKLIGGTP